MEGISEFSEILREYVLIFVSVPMWLYGAAIIAFVTICRFFTLSIFWPLFSGFCLSMLVISLLIFDRSAHILEGVVTIGELPH
jgi:hypothetical protein